LDYVSFAIKLEPGLFTKYGRLHHRRMTEEGPDKETVTIEVGGVLRGINGIPPTLDKYQLSAEKRILKNGQIHDYEKRAKEFKENEEKMKKLMEEQARMKKLKEKQGKNK